MTYYAIVGKGQLWAEVRVEKTPGQPSRQTETGRTWKTTREAKAAIEAMNRNPR